MSAEKELSEEVARLTAILDQVRALGEQWRHRAKHIEGLIPLGYDHSERERLSECAATRRTCADELTARLTENKT